MKIPIISILIILFSISFTYGESMPNKKGNFSKGSFSKNSTWSNTKGNNKKQLGPPGPGGGTGGNPAPISNGMYILLIGSTIFLTKKISNEIKSHKNAKY